MEEDKSRDKENLSTNIEHILRERERLDQVLRKKFQKEVAILFTDICGYTSYMDVHGDISGRVLIQKHNQIVIPLVETHGGVVIKTIGDAVMASFPDPVSAVKASMAIQKGLHKYNHTEEEVNRIFVKIGINSGEALVDESDVFGDVVNVASRIQSQAKAYQILISSSVYKKVKGIEDILCRFHGDVSVKGKANPLQLYRVIWRDEDILISAKPIVRAYEKADTQRLKKPIKVLRLEVAREDKRLKISAHEHIAGEESTLRHYEEMSISMNWIDTQCHEIVNNLNKAIRKGNLKRDIFVKLKETGCVFYKKLFTTSVKKKLAETTAHYLSLYIDDQLVHVPWELLNDGQQFLCQRFNMGRLVRTRQNIQYNKSRVLARPLRMLIIAASNGDLDGAYREGAQIQEDIANENIVDITLRAQDVNPAYLKEKMKYFDILHFAGHTEYNQKDSGKSGWRLDKTNITGEDIIKLPDSFTMPALIFSNACQSARTKEWTLKDHFHNEIFGMANAFLLKGVKHYIGTFWEILDTPSSHFAVEFYKHFFSGMTAGEAIKEARNSLIRQYGEESIVWASYILYGDPTSNYIDQMKTDEATFCPEAVIRSGENKGKQEETRDLPQKAIAIKDRIGWAIGAGMSMVLLILLLFLLINQGAKKENVQNPTPFQISMENAGTDFHTTMQILYLFSSYQDQLTKRFKKKGFFKKQKELDTWTSKPVSICMISPNWDKIDSDESPSFESLKPHFERLFQKLTESFSQTRSLGLSILERERLSFIIQEAQIGIPKLSADSLKDAYNILSAQVILFPTPITYKKTQGTQTEISLRMVETKSSKIIAAFSKVFSPQPGSIQKAVSELTHKTIVNLEQQYPLKGRIISLDKETVRINLGHNVGVFQNQSFNVLDTATNQIIKGTIQVKSIDENTSCATILSLVKVFQNGDPVKALPRKSL